MNTLCFRGKQIEKRQNTNGDDEAVVTHRNKGHWGDLTYPGCMKVREGQAMYAHTAPEDKLEGLLKD